VPQLPLGAKAEDRPTRAAVYDGLTAVSMTVNGSSPNLFREENIVDQSQDLSRDDVDDGDPLQGLLRTLRTADGLRVADLKTIMESAREICGGADPALISMELLRVHEILETVAVWDQRVAAAPRVLNAGASRPRKAEVWMDALAETIEELVAAWGSLAEIEERSRKGVMGLNGAFEPSVNLNLVQRAQSVAPTLDALFDRMLEEIEAFAAQAHAETPYDFYLICRRVERLLTNPDARNALLSMDIPVQELSRRVKRHGTAHDPSSSSGQPQVVPGHFWKAVTKGDVKTVEYFCSSGVATASSLDSNGHSAFWDALAFQQSAVADVLLRYFPPGSPGAVDLAEVHHTRQDTLLHLLCYFDHFDATVAKVMRCVFDSTPAHLLVRLNHRQQSFLFIAAAKLNFWVLSLVLKQCPPEVVQQLFFSADATGHTCCSIMSHSPAAAEAVTRARVHVAPAPREPERVPRHMMFPLDTGARPPFSDVCFRLERGAVVFAHGVLLGAVSEVLRQAIAQAEVAEDAWVVRVHPTITHASSLRYALALVYGQPVRCPFPGQAEHIWELLLLAALYCLPQPVIDFAGDLFQPFMADNVDLCCLLLSFAGEGVAFPMRLRQAAADTVLRSSGSAVPAARKIAALPAAVEAMEALVFPP